MKRHAYVAITAIALLTLNLTACGKQTTSSPATTSKQTSHVVKQPTATFKDNTIKTADMQIKLTDMQVVKASQTTDNHPLLRIGFKITNLKNQDLKPSMANQFLKAYQVINHKPQALTIGASLIKDQTITSQANNQISQNNSANGVLTFILNNPNDPVQLVAVTKHGQVIGKQLVKINQLSQITDNVPTPQPHNNVTTNSTSNVVPNNKQATTPVANYQNKSTTATTNNNVNKQPVNNTPVSSSANNQNSINMDPNTLTGFVNKYGMSPALYKMEHDGMSEKQALESTPDTMKTSGEIQTQYQLEGKQ